MIQGKNKLIHINSHRDRRDDIDRRDKTSKFNDSREPSDEIQAIQSHIEDRFNHQDQSTTTGTTEEPCVKKCEENCQREFGLRFAGYCDHDNVCNCVTEI